MKTKKELALLLSKLKTFEKPKATLEQYQTPSELAADMLWSLNLRNSLEGKNVLDLGCGTGIFGIGALLLGAKSVEFVDRDSEVLALAQENYILIQKILGIKLRATFTCQDIRLVKKKADVVIQNPPFGVQQEHADKEFLIVAMNVAPLIYSVHKIESEKFIDKLAKDNGFTVVSVIPYTFQLKRTQKFHSKEKYDVKVGLWELVKEK